MILGLGVEVCPPRTHAKPRGDAVDAGRLDTEPRHRRLERASSIEHLVAAADLGDDLDLGL
ncbi:hypothetical protein AVW09_15435 [Microbacterium sp. T32]|nr:hypothetical protein AVW09_15435 [Microbacterium sp. T32]